MELIFQTKIKFTKINYCYHYITLLHYIRNSTGYYVDSAQNASTLRMTKEEMYNVMCTELQKGCIDYSKIKAGFIGEVGSSWPITGK